jgi:hypothetical protein
MTLRPAFHGLAAIAAVAVLLLPAAEASFRTKPLAEISQERRLITGTQANVTSLVQVLARPGLTITNAEILLGEAGQFGLFEGGSDSIGISSGVILSTGGVGDVKGPNRRNSTTFKFNGPGYAPLNALLPSGTDTFDAAVLKIDFTCDSGASELLRLKYVWASEEYNEVRRSWALASFVTVGISHFCLCSLVYQYVNEDFNDVFVSRTRLARIQTTSSQYRPNRPLSLGAGVLLERREYLQQRRDAAGRQGRRDRLCELRQSLQPGERGHQLQLVCQQRDWQPHDRVQH